MSYYSIAGFVVAIILIVVAIVVATDNYLAFVSLESAMIVVGGTIATAFLSFQGRYVVKAMRDITRVFSHAKVNETIYLKESRRVIEWASIVKVNGILALESNIKKEKDHISAYGIQLVVDGYKPEEIRELLTNIITSTYERATVQVTILRSMASNAPAFGMVGTLIGLIIMLGSLGDDASALGGGLAVALLTTLYGVLFAKMLLQPAADKTLQREQIYRFRNCLLMEAFVMLAEERTPRYVESRINSFLDADAVAKLPKPKRAGASS
jgi:chemotaxis protein MotA